MATYRYPSGPWNTPLSEETTRWPKRYLQNRRFRPVSDIPTYQEVPNFLVSNMLSRAEARGAFRRAGGGRDPRGGHRSGAHRGGQPDDVGGGGSKVAGPGSGGAGVSDHDDDPAHVQHRQRAGQIGRAHV